MAEKYVKVSDIEEYCSTYSACLVGKEQSVTQAALRRVSEFAAENTADVQPVIHAHWIELPKAMNPNENPCKCSNCGHVVSFMNHYPKSNYCPNCGAKMRGEDDA